MIQGRIFHPLRFSQATLENIPFLEKISQIRYVHFIKEKSLKGVLCDDPTIMGHVDVKNKKYISVLTCTWKSISFARTVSN